jgi:hypothetical protein
MKNELKIKRFSDLSDKKGHLTNKGDVCPSLIILLTPSLILRPMVVFPDSIFLPLLKLSDMIPYLCAVQTPNLGTLKQDKEPLERILNISILKSYHQ